MTAFLPPSPFPASLLSLADCSPLQIRYRICKLEFAMREALARGELEEQEFPVTHTFVDGKYIRGIFLPKGSLIIGKLHIHEHPFTIWQGQVSVVTEFTGLQLLTARYDGVSPAATKRAIFVHSDTIWSGTHSVPFTDLDQIEAAVIAKSYTQLGLYDPMLQLQFESEELLCG